LNRRSFIRGSAITGAALAASTFLAGCKGATEPENITPVPVDLQFDVYNHTQGFLTSFTKTGIMSGTKLTLYPSTIVYEHGLQHVDNSRIALRQDNFGSLIQYARGGGAQLEVPRANKSYDIFLFNDSAVEFYNWKDDLSARWNNWAMMYTKNHLTFFRADRDDITGEERVWGGELLPEIGDYGVFDQINNALKPVWAPFRYGLLDRRPDLTNGDCSYGFGAANGSEFWSTAHMFVVVNPGLLTTVAQQVAGGFAAILESLMGWNNLGNYVTYQPIQSNGVLNQVGKDFFAYMFVRDPGARNIP